MRAYYRKRHLDPTRPHLDLIGELFGCDISRYPAHLATLNLAAREINDEANYPRIKRQDFFDFDPPDAFCEVPGADGVKQLVVLPSLDAVVGNPPYVRQEKIDKPDKRKYGQVAGKDWPNLRLTGRSDLHCYFWPAAARLLKPDGYFGFLTSSSWMDVEYGFGLQGWMLRHFRVLAIMESAAEPWFEDARVKTCATILQRCDDKSMRMANRVRFVRFERELVDIIAVTAGEDEAARQAAVDTLRDRILGAESDCQHLDLRIIVRTQRDLWDAGVRAGSILSDAADRDTEDEADESDDTEDNADTKGTYRLSNGQSSAYRAGKWGRYVRAPELYFEVMARFADRFVALGEIAHIRFGVKTGCDAFFMPKDVTGTMLSAHPTDGKFRQAAGGASRREVKQGKLKIIQAGDGSVHPIEVAYVAPEVHSLMKVERPIVRAVDLDRVVLMVSEPLGELRKKAPWVWRYLRYGATAPFASTKSNQSRCQNAPRARPGSRGTTLLVLCGRASRFGRWHNSIGISSRAIPNILYATTICSMLPLRTSRPLNRRHWWPCSTLRWWDCSRPFTGDTRGPRVTSRPKWST